MLLLGLVPVERFWAKVQKTETCWLWEGALDRTGYGFFQFNRQARRYRFQAHRLAYELLVGPIPSGLDLDHTCHNSDLFCAGGHSCRHRRCCNPAHLEPVTRSVNLRRGRPAGTFNRNKTHCPRGHPYDLLNTSFGSRGQRICRTCNRERQRVSA